MSAATQQAVNDAIEAHLADEEDGAISRGWILSCIGQTVDDAMLDPSAGSSARGYWLVAPGQLIPMSIGLAHEFIRQVETQPYTEDE